MKSIKVLFLITPIFLMSILAYGQVFLTPEPKPPTFIEEKNIPEGKAVIYIYRSPNVNEEFKSRAPLILTKEGAIGILPHSSFYALIVEPGKIKYWFVCDKSREIDVEVLSGQSYYIKVEYDYNLFPQYIDLKILLIPEQKARTEKEILYCNRIK
jgi:hypothetical protein